MQIARFTHGQILAVFACFIPILIMAGQVISFSRVTKISDLKNLSTDEKRDIYNTFDSEDQIDKGLPIDPFDLMNRLKQAEAMENATSASDALDEALNAFDHSAYENVPIE
tara:strand:- start:24 stop:356 length:333 start_codon:yes stop_codon:yes gene_type:complete